MTDRSLSYLGAHDYTSTTVKRIVILSSTAAITNAKIPGKVYTEKDWNDEAIDAVKKNGRGANGGEKYSASKALAEKGRCNERDSQPLCC